MGTRAGVFRDLIFSTPAAGQLANWLDGLAPTWPGWDVERRRFQEGRTGSLVMGAGASRIAYVRLLEVDFADLVSRNPPGALFDLYAQADPYAAIDDIDPEAPDYDAQVGARRSVYWKIRGNPAKVARVRQFWARMQPVYDGDGNQIGLREAGLQFARFGDSGAGWNDPAGEGEA